MIQCVIGWFYGEKNATRVRTNQEKYNLSDIAQETKTNSYVLYRVSPVI